MSELKPRITENGIDYILVGDYYIPDLKLPEEHPILGKARTSFQAIGLLSSF